ncbi:DUF3775 domain-containing protein [Microvirga massiliensis]|uniref:DUF3775 domain-containing protein n=1 Tax=Microvirga massiliensis TaxID=1033741 RepID=UPI00062B9B30|nr:DUF3775 domain-containing protein [Microvirga massiliensis]
MLRQISVQQVQQIIAMCHEHVANLPEDPDSAGSDLWNSDVATLSPAAKAVRDFHTVLSSQIADLSKEAQVELLALMMIGRYPDDFRSFGDAVAEARSEFDRHTPGYLADKQLVLAKYLESGLQVMPRR